MSFRIEGLVAAPHTPMHPDGRINMGAIDRQAALLHSSGVAGVFVCGTTGEGLSMTSAERMDVAARWIQVAPKGLTVIVHVGHASVTEARALAAHAEKSGAAAIGAMAPFFFKPSSPADLAAVCAEIAGGAPETPFYYYHIPSMTGVAMPMVRFLEAAAGRVPTLAGIKYTYEDMMDFELCRAFDGGRFDMLFGRDEALLCGLALGARGAVGSTYNFAAPLYLEIIRAFDAGDLATARRLQRRSMELIQLLIAAPSGFMHAAKSMMKVLGVDCGPVRPPLKNLTAEQFKALEAGLERLKFSEYAPRSA